MFWCFALLNHLFLPLYLIESDFINIKYQPSQRNVYVSPLEYNINTKHG